MKNYFLILFTGLILISCKRINSIIDGFNLKKEKLSEFNVKIDTLISTKNGDLTKVVLFKNNFYCMFETSRKNTSQQFIKMLVFNQKGKFIEDVFVPEEIQNMSHYDLIVEKDSLYVKENQFEKENFVLGEYVADLNKIKTRNFAIFKDEIYTIYSDSKGEWGGTIFFENNKTREVFETYSSCAVVVNKIKKEYYVTNSGMYFSNVLKISEPTKLHKSKLNLNENEGSKYHEGVTEILNIDDVNIATSFVNEEKLFHLYSDKKNVFVGVIENGKMKSQYKFDFNFYPHLNQTLDNGKQLLTFYIPSSKENGILIIDQKNFYFHILK
ncbi:hypothetical protein ACHRV1_04540 [Flavobacterium aquidurense]|uniref:hypothetical protein n=1 Tax=Flavobacterium aquidurense TaxID=362413 RepID=UPI00375706C1